MQKQALLILIAELMVGALVRRWEILVPLLALNTLLLLWLSERRCRIASTAMPARREGLSVKIAHETLPYLRHGLNQDNAGAIAKIIQEISQVAAVSITDREKQLAYLGVGCDKHQPGDKILTEATREVIRTGKHKVVRTQKELNCPRESTCVCPLATAVIVPLRCRGKVVGTVKLYETKDGQLSPDVIRLALGMAQILSLQIELAELEHQAKLAAEAQLNALQAQINPHFLFNVLNTIIATSRSNPTRTRRLLIHLAQFFRRALKTKGTVISLREEMEFVNTYLILEKARFGRKLQVKEDIPPDLWDAAIPRLSLQPLVENAVKHGITPKIGKGTVHIQVEKVNNDLCIRVRDDGMGIAPERLRDLFVPGASSGSGNGVGLTNVHERLCGLYGEQSGLRIQSEQNVGTIVTMTIPYTKMSTEQALNPTRAELNAESCPSASSAACRGELP